MNVVFFGAGTFGLPSFEALLDGPHHVLALVTSPDKPHGRGLEVQPQPLKSLALQKKIPVMPFSDPRSTESMDALKDLKADAFVVVSFGVLFSEALLTIPSHGCINLHASLLPRHRGASPIAYALWKGDAETGATTFRLTQRLDAGDILLQKKVPIAPEENALDVFEKLSQMGGPLLNETLTGLEEGRLNPVSQEEDQATTAPKLKKEVAWIRWQDSAASIHNHIRAFCMWPGSKTRLKNKIVILTRSTYSNTVSAASQAVPGTVTSVEASQGIEVATGSGTLYITQLKPEGKKTQHFKDFLNGHRLQKGDRFE